MRKCNRGKLRVDLEERQLPFRLMRGGFTGKLRKDGWLRCIRQATGTPVGDMARRMGVTPWEVNRLEKSEQCGGIRLRTLRKAAERLGCELVYALVPIDSSLDELAEEQDALKTARWEKRAKKRGSAKEKSDWREELFEAMRVKSELEGFPVGGPRRRENPKFRKLFALLSAPQTESGPLGG